MVDNFTNSLIPGVRKHINDLAVTEAADDGSEVKVVVHEITENGEIILIKEKEAKSTKVKPGKRNRTVSVSDDIKIDGVIVKKRKSSEIDMKEVGLEETKVEDESKTQPLEVDDQKKEKDMEQEEDKELKVSPKKKKKKDKKKADEGQNDVVEKEEKKEIRDPGWDFSATCITAPSWKRSSIWSEDELEDDEASEETEKSHVSKAEAKRRKRVEEEQAAAR